MRKILLYGMGNEAKKFVKQIGRSTLWRIVAITDSTVNTGAGYAKFEDISIPVVMSNEVEKIECDYIVIGSTKYEEEIRQVLEEKVSAHDKILTIGEFYYNAFIKENEKKLQDNSLYHFLRNKQHLFVNKWFHYYQIYDRYFRQYRGTDVVFLEIGVFKGGSLQMWRDYFGEKATIIGVDIDEACKKYEQGNTKVEIGSQEDPEFWEYIKNKYPRIDILLDDGGHTMNQQITTFESMFSAISNTGIYMCEDTHTSYMEQFGSGYGAKNFIEYSKKWVDDLHAYFSKVLIPGYNTDHIYSIHYYNSIVVVEKEEAADFPIIIRDDSSIMTADMSVYKMVSDFYTR